MCQRKSKRRQSRRWHSRRRTPLFICLVRHSPVTTSNHRRPHHAKLPPQLVRHRPTLRPRLPRPVRQVGRNRVLTPQHHSPPRPSRNNRRQTVALSSQSAKSKLSAAMVDRPRSPQRPRPTQRRRTRSIPPRRRRLPSQVDLASRHQSRQLRVLARPNLRQRV